MDTWLSKWILRGKLSSKVVQISLCQLHTLKRCELQFKKKPGLLKTQVIEERTMIWVYFDFWTCLSEHQFNVWSPQHVERLGDFDPLHELPGPAAWGSLSSTWLHICLLPLSAVLIFMPEQEPCGSPGPFCLFQLLLSWASSPVSVCCQLPRKSCRRVACCVSADLWWGDGGQCSLALVGQAVFYGRAGKWGKSNWNKFPSIRLKWPTRYYNCKLLERQASCCPGNRSSTPDWICDSWRK